MSKRPEAMSQGSTTRNLPHLHHPSTPDCWIRALAALSLSACLVGWVGQAAAQDTDGDGLSDAVEVSRVRTVPFGAQQVITSSADGANSTFAVDLDGDGDPDALSASGTLNTVAWYENRLDEPSADFGPQRAVATGTTSYSVFAVDLDGDGYEDGEEVLVMGTDPLDSLDPAPAATRRGPRRHRVRR